MRDFKTVFFRILFVVVIVLCVWQCNAHKKGKMPDTATTTIAAVTTTTVQADVSADMVTGDESGD